MANTSYKDITSLTGLKGVRAKLSMYLGGTQCGDDSSAPRALHQMLIETVSNALDEYVAGYGNIINVYRLSDDTLIVTDYGRGVPQGKNLDDMIRAFTVPHSSGKFDDSAYANAGVAGTHGIGMKAVNAASREMLVVSKRDGNVAAIRFAKGEQVESSLDNNQSGYCSVITDRLDTIVTNWLDSASTGTLIAFMPDDGPISDSNMTPVLESISLSKRDMIEQLRTAAFLHPGVQLNLHDELENTELSWKYNHGLAEYMAERDDLQLEDIRSVHQSGIRLSDASDSKSIGYDISLYPVVAGGNINCYVNGVVSSQGAHVVALRNGLTQAVKRHTGKNYSIDDVMGALTVMLHVKLPSSIAQFEGQTKDTLATNSIRRPLKDALARRISELMTEDKQFAKELAACVKAQAKRRKDIEKLSEQTRRAREAAKKPSLKLSSKLKKAQSRNPEERELYIVEGDSASNIGRDPRTQAVFPIRGKIINAFKQDMAAVLKNEEVTTLVSALGAGLLDDFDPSKLKYHKVIINSDKDSDGEHISVLLTGMCFKLFPGLIESGHLYCAEPPLYKATRYRGGKAEHVMIYSESEMSKRRSELEGYVITRFKGLGEMNVEEAREALADPKTRRLIRVTMDDAVKAEQVLDMLIGNNMQARREWTYNQLSNTELQD